MRREESLINGPFGKVAGAALETVQPYFAIVVIVGRIARPDNSKELAACIFFTGVGLVKTPKQRGFVAADFCCSQRERTGQT